MRKPPPALGETYDIIFDTVGKTSFARCKSSLKPNGIFLEAAINGLAILPQVLWTSMFGRKKMKIAATGLRPASERTKDLIFLKELMEAEKIKPVIDRRYPLEQIDRLVYQLYNLTDEEIRVVEGEAAQ